MLPENEETLAGCATGSLNLLLGSRMRRLIFVGITLVGF